MTTSLQLARCTLHDTKSIFFLVAKLFGNFAFLPAACSWVSKKMLDYSKSNVVTQQIVERADNVIQSFHEVAL